MASFIRLRAIGFAILWALLSLSCAVASDTIMISDAWIRETPPNAQVSAGYMTIKNHGIASDRLIAVSADFANTSEIHEVTMQGDVMKMRPVENGIEIDAGKVAKLLPTEAFHLMFIGLKKRPVAGTTFDIVLVFERAGSISLSVPVLNRMIGMGHRHNDSENHSHSH